MEPEIDNGAVFILIHTARTSRSFHSNKETFFFITTANTYTVIGYVTLSFFFVSFYLVIEMDIAPCRMFEYRDVSELSIIVMI